MERAPRSWTEAAPHNPVSKLLHPLGLHPGASWAFSWIALFAGGVMLMGAPNPPGPWLVAHLFTSAFPALQLIGAFGFVGRPAPSWILPLAIGLGLLRGILWQTFGPAAGFALALTFEPVALFAAAVIVRRADLLEGAAWMRWLLVAGMAGLGVLEAVDAFTGLNSPEPQVRVLWRLVLPTAALVQIGAMWFWIAARETRIERAEAGRQELANEMATKSREEEALRRQEAWLFDFYETSPDMLLTLRPSSYEILRCNRKLSECLGHGRLELVGCSIFELLDPTTADHVRKRLDGLEPGGHLADLALRLLRRDGGSIEVLADLLLRAEYPGEPPEIRCVLRDVGRFKKSLGRMPPQDDMHRLLTVHSPVGIFFSEPNGRVTFTNRRYCELGGITPRVARESVWLDRIHPEDRERVVRTWFDAVRERRAWRSRHRIVPGTGVVNHVLFEARPLLRSGGELSGMIGAATLLEATGEETGRGSDASQLETGAVRKD